VADVYVALLRGINLGTRNRIGMADLRAVVEALGGEDVATHVQSGNVVFRSRHPSAAAVEKKLAARLESDTRLSVDVMVRTAAELERICAANPYADREQDPKKLHVAFLAARPSRDAVEELGSRAKPPEAVTVNGREAYLHLPGGLGRSELAASVEKVLGTATMRNWRTVLALAELALARRGS
jgi:uncharacterized protein (DUF1697 family)